MATRTYAKAFRIEAVRLLGLGEKPASQLAQEPGIRRSHLYKWRDRIEGKGEVGAFRGPGRRPAPEESEIARLKRELERVRGAHPLRAAEVPLRTTSSPSQTTRIPPADHPGSTSEPPLHPHGAGGGPRNGSAGP